MLNKFSKDAQKLHDVQSNPCSIGSTHTNVEFVEFGSNGEIEWVNLEQIERVHVG
jgi:hypothetical protein